ncbi:MAG: RNA 2',3'-cyclic phosphodiesterase [Nitrospiraceae bacterium]|nr:RNA 2',3'-cyclic phosphodiesterase [Nitrospiraceae bacterium]
MDLRCFIAIELPDSIKENISIYIQKLKEIKTDVKWVSEKNLHVTLKFLGNVPERMIQDINNKLLAIGRLHDKFHLYIQGAGIFPNTKQPRVIWLGLKDSGNVVNLQQDIEDGMSELGFKKDGREFKPHLTIGRVKSFKNIGSLIKELTTLKEVDFGKIEVKNISLMKSELKQAGAEHSKLSQIFFGN